MPHTEYSTPAALHWFEDLGHGVAAFIPIAGERSQTRVRHSLESFEASSVPQPIKTAVQFTSPPTSNEEALLLLGGSAVGGLAGRGAATVATRTAAGGARLSLWGTALRTGTRLAPRTAPALTRTTTTATAYAARGARVAVTTAAIGAGVGATGWLAGMGLDKLGEGVGGAFEGFGSGIGAGIERLTGGAGQGAKNLLLPAAAVLGAILLLRRGK